MDIQFMKDYYDLRYEEVFGSFREVQDGLEVDDLRGGCRLCFILV